VSASGSASSVDKDAEETRGLSMGLFANGILFGLQVLQLRHCLKHLHKGTALLAACIVSYLQRQAPATHIELASVQEVIHLHTASEACAAGLQPDALFVIIPALTLPRWAAVSYIFMFVIGTVAAMGGYTAVIGAISIVYSTCQQGKRRDFALKICRTEQTASTYPTA
jgi:hypothetical protein